MIDAVHSLAQSGAPPARGTLIHETSHTRSTQADGASCARRTPFHGASCAGDTQDRIA